MSINKYIILCEYLCILEYIFLTFSDVGPYDIGLLKLATPLKLSKQVQSIKLAPPESDPTGEAWLCGWGSIGGSIFPEMPDKLQHVKLEYVDRVTCHEAVERLTGSSPVHETNVCTGPLYDGISACSVSSSSINLVQFVYYNNTVY